MTDAEIAARLTEALVEAADKSAGAATDLVSANITVTKRAEIAAIETTLDRQTRTMLFLTADARDAHGEHIAAASSVHKI